MADLSTGIDELLPGWLISRRWYVGKGRAPRLRRSGGVQWLSADGDALLETLFVVDESGPEPVTYQVPLTYRAEPVDALHTALVGRVEDVDDGLGTRYVYDAVHDPAFIQAVLDLIDSESTVTTTGADPSGATASGGTARGHLVGRGGNRAVVRRCAVLSGEQSNTSIIVETEGPEPQPLIIKVFRVLQAGDNPDVAVQSALAQAGSVLVPRPLGFVSGRWPAPAGSEVAGHLAFAQEFLPGVQDAWRTALAAAEAEQDFTGRTRELGEATAAVHATLREAFGTEPMAPEARDGLLQRMRRRHEAAVTEVPELSRHREEVEELYAAAAATDWPALQRVHGDYHLGQVLDVPDRGWVLVDFEGEPLRALEERNAPDLPLRDVAGMLRSFDYAAGSVGQERDLDRESWATACRTAFLDGYAAQAGEDPRDHADLLDALELDKALYEVVYEARNRPTWIGIPVAAIDRILARRRTPAPAAGAGPSSPPPPAAAPVPGGSTAASTTSPGAPAASSPAEDDPAFVPDATVVVQQASVWFGHKVALTELSCSFGPGVTGLLGPNGAGKTTLMRAIVGLLPLNDGRIHVLGRDPHRERDIQRTIALVPEDEAVPPALTARQLVRYTAALHRVSDRSLPDRCLATVGLLDVADRRVGKFSKGMRQRAKVASALVTDPRVLVLDEPLNGADPVQRVALIDLFHALGDQGRTVIVSSHVLHEVERLASRQIVVIRGRLAAAGEHHAIRDGLADRPRSVLLRSPQSRDLAAQLVGFDVVRGVTVDGQTVVVTSARAGELAELLPRVARDAGARLLEVRPLDDSLESVFRELLR